MEQKALQVFSIHNNNSIEYICSDSEENAKNEYCKYYGVTNSIISNVSRKPEYDAYIELNGKLNKKLIERRNKQFINCTNCKKIFHINEYLEYRMTIGTNCFFCNACYIKHNIVSFIHCIKRLQQRYNLYEDDFFRILRILQLDDFTILEDNYDFTNAYKCRCEYNHIHINLVYDINKNKLITFLPYLDEDVSSEKHRRHCNRKLFKEKQRIYGNQDLLSEDNFRLYMKNQMKIKNKNLNINDYYDAYLDYALKL